MIGATPNLVEAHSDRSRAAAPPKSSVAGGDADAEVERHRIRLCKSRSTLRSRKRERSAPLAWSVRFRPPAAEAIVLLGIDKNDGNAKAGAIGTLAIPLGRATTPKHTIVVELSRDPVATRETLAQHPLRNV
jgi:hypothetical protein